MDYKLLREYMKYRKCLHNPLPFYAMIYTFDPFLNLRKSANHDKVEGHLAINEILIKGVETLL